jgi:hypothetical protein
MSMSGNTYIRLARSRPSDDQQRLSDMAVRRHAVLDGPALFRIERIEIGSGRSRQHESVPQAG